MMFCSTGCLLRGADRTETTTTAADELAHYDGFSRPRPRPTDLALAAVHAVHPDASAQRFPIQHARRASDGETLCASGTVSVDAF